MKTVFTQFGTGYTNRAGRDQLLGQPRRLVAFRVGSPVDAMLAAGSRHRGNVGFQRIQVDAQRGRIEIRLGAPKMRQGHSIAASSRLRWQNDEWFIQGRYFTASPTIR